MDDLNNQNKISKIGKWYGPIKIFDFIVIIIIFGIVSILFIYTPILFFNIFGEINDTFLLGTGFIYSIGTFFLIFTIIPFRNLINNYRAGFHTRVYKNVTDELLIIEIKSVLDKMNKSIEIQNEFEFSKIFRAKGTLINIHTLGIKILIEKDKRFPKENYTIVSIGKITEKNLYHILEYEKKIDSKLSVYIKD